jgi:hypothetical protein
VYLSVVAVKSRDTELHMEETRRPTPTEDSNLIVSAESLQQQ